MYAKWGAAGRARGMQVRILTVAIYEQQHNRRNVNRDPVGALPAHVPGTDVIGRLETS